MEIDDGMQELAFRMLRQHPDSNNPSSFLAVNEGNHYYTDPAIPGVVVYRPAGRYLIQFGGPFAGQDDYLPLLESFRRFAEQQHRTIVGIQLQRADAERYAKHGFTVNQVGASYAVKLADFSLSGGRFMRLRNKITRAERAGLVAREATVDEVGSAMHEVDSVWLRSKGEGVHQLEYLVGQYGGRLQSQRRLFVGMIDDQLVGYISYSPVYGAQAGWMHDLSRRVPGELPGIMEAINHKAIETFRAEGVDWLHFGFTPFTSLSPDREVPGYDPGFSQLVQLLWEYGEAVYPARTQLAYKQKWAPGLVLTEYIAFDGNASVAGFVNVFRAAGALG